MEFIDLQHQQQQISALIHQNIAKVLHHGKYIGGPEIHQLEEKLKDFLSDEYHVIACANGTDAIQVACMGLGLKPGDEVITTPLSFMATVEVIVLLGLTPVFVDVEAETGNLDPRYLEAAISPRTKLILPVSLYGQCANYREINKIAAEHGIPVLEDGAESFGAKHHGQYSGSLTGLATTSFFPAKPLGCYGDGGAVFVRDTELATKIRCICKHGQSARYLHSEIGVNSRLDTLQAAILLAKLEIFREEHLTKQKIAQRYYKALRGKVRLLEVQPENESAYGYFPIIIQNRTPLCTAFEEAGVPYSLHFPALHTQPALAQLGYQPGAFPVTKEIAEHVVTIPMHAYLSEVEQEEVISCILNYI